jgi:hypothetical protein
MGVVTRNHLEAFTLLLQNEFRGQRLQRVSARRRNGVCLREGHSRRERGSIHARCCKSSAHENGQLARNATEKLLPIIFHGHPNSAKS